MAEQTGAAFGIYPSSGRRPERLNQSRNVNAPLQLARGWAAGLLGLPGDIEGLVRMLPGIQNETPVLPTSDFYREYLPGYDPRPAARALSGLGALTGGAGATSVVRGGLGAVKRATDVNAIRDYVRAAQGVGGMPGAAVVKPKGGNWISGAGSPEEAVRVLKASAVGMDPAERIPLLDNLIREQEAAGAVTSEFLLDRMRVERGRLTGDAELNRWIDQKLAKYIRNEMGTPEDPVRALAERDILHVDPEQLNFRTELHGKYLGPGQTAVAVNPAARTWEGASDQLIGTTRAGDLLSPDVVGIDALGSRRDIADMYLRENPWLAKVPPETPVYSIENAEQALHTDLGFGHLVDELRNAVREGSDLPAELRLRPEQLSKVSMPQAVELVDRINKWRAAQKAEADLARAGNAATVEYKAYDTVPGTALPNERGLRWVELKQPTTPENWSAPERYEIVRPTPSAETFAIRDKETGKYITTGLQSEAQAVEHLHATLNRSTLEDALKYEGETMGHCVGGYCPDVMEGRSRIFSLRDAKGQPHVTVEVKPSSLTPYDAWYREQQVGSPELLEFERYLNQNRDRLREISGPRGRKGLEVWYEQWVRDTGRPMVQPQPDIKQIKGKANKAPKDEYLPYVQDFVRSGRWGRVGDLQNTGLVDISAYPDAPEYLKRGSRFISQQEYDDAVRRAIQERNSPGAAAGQGFARGGAVRAPAAGPLTYDPDRIAALAEQLTMEA